MVVIIRAHTVGICVYGSRSLFATLVNSSKLPRPRVRLQSPPVVCYGTSRLISPPPPPLTPAVVTATGRLRSVSTFRVSSSSQVNDSGSIDSPLMQSMEKKIKEHLNAESVTVKDAYGDGRHVSIDVVASAFEGESAVNRQRMVYKSIWEELQNTVHAVDQMTTRTPNEAK